MSVLDQIKNGMRTAVRRLSEDGWTYRTRTSAAGVEPRTWSAWATLPALPTADADVVQFDERMDGWAARETRALRCLDSPRLANGDQVQAPDGKIWSVDAIQSGAGGTLRYMIGRETPRKNTANRGGAP